MFQHFEALKSFKYTQFLPHKDCLPTTMATFFILFEEVIILYSYNHTKIKKKCGKTSVYLMLQL